jgi:TRAP-type C4-dicarboxylate transport system substrate-binding protein
MQQALIGGAQEMMVGSTATLVGITKEMALWDTPFPVQQRQGGRRRCWTARSARR